MRKITAMMAQRSIQTAQAPSLTFDNVIRSGMPTQPPFNTTVYGMCRQSAVPSPGSPVAVESVSGALTSGGTNVLDAYQLSQTADSGWDTPGTTVRVTASSGSIKVKAWGSAAFGNAWVLSALKPSTTYYVRCKIKVLLSPNENYTTKSGLVKGLLLYSSASGYAGYYIVLYNQALQVCEEIEYAGTFTTPSGLHDTGANYRVYAYTERWLNTSSSADYATVLFSDFIISETDSSYLPYRGITYPIPTLNGINVSDPAIANLVYTDAGTTKYAVTDTFEPCVRVGGVERSRTVRRVGAKVFDGTEAGWSIQNSTDYSYLKSILGASLPNISRNFICSHFEVVSWNAITGQCWVGNQYINFNYDGQAGGIDNFKSFLAANPVTVYYILATPVTTLGDQMPLETYHPQTNIFTTSAVPHQIRASVLVPRHIA